LRIRESDVKLALSLIKSLPYWTPSDFFPPQSLKQPDIPWDKNPCSLSSLFDGVHMTSYRWNTKVFSSNCLLLIPQNNSPQADTQFENRRYRILLPVYKSREPCSSHSSARSTESDVLCEPLLLWVQCAEGSVCLVGQQRKCPTFLLLCCRQNLIHHSKQASLTLPSRGTHAHWINYDVTKFLPCIAMLVE
jgi:hypothetical protein